MATRQRRSSSRTPRRAARDNRSLWRSPGVWLATLSTVVGVATGMFTLRDQVWPDQGGSAQAVDASAYGLRVGGVCDDLNDSDRADRADDRKLERQLRRARSATAQRNVLLDAARRTLARSSDALAAFSALNVPRSAAAVHRRTVAGWQRNLDRVSIYVERLDRARNRRGVLAAVELLSRQRTALARDALSVRTDLGRLGGDNCDLGRPSVSKTVTLPAAPTPRPTPSPAASPDPTPAVVGTPTPSPTATPGPDAPIEPRINTPHPTTPKPAPTPSRPGASSPTPDPVTQGGSAP